MKLFGQEFPPEDTKEEKGVDEKDSPSSSLLKKAGRWARTGAMILATQFPSPDAKAEGMTSEEESAKKKVELAFGETGSVEEKTASYTLEKTETEKGVVTIEIENKFETDRATVSPENAESIEQTLNEIWKDVTPETLESFLASKITVEASADPDQSSYKSSRTGEIGNPALAEDRAVWLKDRVRESLEGYDFSMNGLSEENIAKVKSIEILIKTPDDGVKQLTEIENPKTGQNYTEEELQKLSSSEIEELKQQARVAKVIFEQTEKSKRTGSLDEIFNITKDSPKIFIFFDNSSSMTDNEQAVELARKNARHEGEVLYGTFSDKLDLNVKNAETLKAKESIISGLGSPNERIFQATTEALEKVDVGSSVIFLTDENLQRGSIAGIKDLIEKAENKKITVTYGIINPETKQTSYFSLNEILAYARSEYSPERKETHQRLQEEIASHKKEMASLSKTNPKHVEYERLIKQKQEQIEDLYSMSDQELLDFLK